MGAGRSLTSWGKRGRFTYQGSIDLGTRVLHGRHDSFVVPAEAYAALLAHFRGRSVPIGASQNPPRDSLGGWLRSHAGPDAKAAYVGPILVKEGYAERVSPTEIRFPS